MSVVEHFYDTTSGWPVQRMISWPRLHSLTGTTSRASSSPELPTNDGEPYRPLAAERRLHHPAVRDVPRHIPRRRDVERGVQGPRLGGRDGAAGQRLHFLGRPLLDGNRVAVRQPQVDRRGGRTTVEGHAVMEGEHGEAVRADL